MSEDVGRGADEIRTSGSLSGEIHDEGRRICEGDVRLNRRPTDGTLLEAEGAEEGEDAAKEALDAGALAEFVSSPAMGKQARFTQQERLEDMTCVRDVLLSDR